MPAFGGHFTWNFMDFSALFKNKGAAAPTATTPSVEQPTQAAVSAQPAPEPTVRPVAHVKMPSIKLPLSARAWLWMRRTTQWREIASLAFIMAVTLVLWNTWAVYPLKLLVVFFHEFSQGLVGVFTGGSIKSIQITGDMAGACEIEGGHALAIALAGYWGSLAWGFGLYILALKWSKATWINVALGVMIYTVSVLYVRPVISMGMVMAVLSGAGIVVAAIKLPQFVNRMLLKVVALTNCLYAVFDVRAAETGASSLQSDAERLAELTGMPAVLWSLLWIAVALPAVVFLLLALTRRPLKQ